MEDCAVAAEGGCEVYFLLVWDCFAVWHVVGGVDGEREFVVDASSGVRFED